jgi:hypothetical protein
MELEVESRLLIESLESGAPHDVRWTEHTTENPAGRRVSTSFDVGARMVRRSYMELSSHDRALDIVRLGPDVRLALELYREAIALSETNWEAAQARAFVAIEVLVRNLTGSTERGRWRDAGQASRFGKTKALQLYLSLQSGRHADVQHTKQKLRDIRRKKLPFAECLEWAAQFIQKMLDYRLRHP